MRTVDASGVDPIELEALDNVVATFGEDSQLGAAISTLAITVRAGTDVSVAAHSENVTPAQAASILGMSRTHLYKILDSGDLQHTRVGRDRRIAIPDLIEFGRKREHERRELAERFAHQSSARDALVRRHAGVDDH